jgi:hypothetical protein
MSDALQSIQPYTVRLARCDLLDSLLQGLEGLSNATPRTSKETAALIGLLGGVPPGPDEAELVGRLVRHVLSAAGATSIHGFLQALATCTAARPTWDRATRELRWQGRVVKRWRHDAANQIAVLDAFEAEGWQPCIAYPLVHRRGSTPKARRRDTIHSLNEHLAAGTIHFFAGGAGDGVRWAVA